MFETGGTVPILRHTSNSPRVPKNSDQPHKKQFDQARDKGTLVVCCKRLCPHSACVLKSGPKPKSSAAFNSKSLFLLCTDSKHSSSECSAGYGFDSATSTCIACTESKYKSDIADSECLDVPEGASVTGDLIVNRGNTGFSEFLQSPHTSTARTILSSVTTTPASFAKKNICASLLLWRSLFWSKNRSTTSFHKL